MTDRKTLTLNLTEAEMKALETLAKDKDLTKTAVLRQALRSGVLVRPRQRLRSKPTPSSAGMSAACWPSPAATRRRPVA